MKSIETAFIARVGIEPELKTSAAGKPWTSLSACVGEVPIATTNSTSEGTMPGRSKAEICNSRSQTKARSRDHTMTNIIIIEPTTVRGDRGTRYCVYYEGAVLIEETWNPELDACRLLAARGITGHLEVWRAGKAHVDMVIADITRAATRTVKENEKVGPRFVPWAPLPDDLQPDSVSRDPVFASAAENFLYGVTDP